MLHLIKSHWGWLFGALTIGVIIGGATWHRARGRWVDRALSLGAAVVAAGILVAYLGLVHGRAGARLDLALAIIGVCTIGYVFGWLIRDVADVPALADAGWPAAPMLDGMVRPPYLSKPGQIPWAVVVGGPDAVAAWTAKRAGASTIGRGMEAAPAAAKLSSEPAASTSPSTVSSVSRNTAIPAAAPEAPSAPPSPIPPAPRPIPAVAAPVSVTAASEAGSSAGRDGSYVSQGKSPESVVASSSIASRPDGPASVPVPASPALPETEPVQGSLASSSADKAGSAELPLSPLEPTAAAPSAGPGESPASTAQPVVVASTPLQVPEPAPSPPVLDEEKHGGTRPAGLVTARGGAADVLTRIKGIGPQNETRLHGLGIWHFAQIASWTPDNVHWVGSYLAFPGRIDREKWVEQAVVLAAGGAGVKDGLAGKPRPRR